MYCQGSHDLLIPLPDEFPVDRRDAQSDRLSSAIQTLAEQESPGKMSPS